MKNIFKINKNINHRSQAGFSVIEVLIACMIMSTMTFALMSAASKGIELSIKALKQVQANELLEEGVEAVKSIRDTNWGSVSGLSGTYYLSFNTNTNIWSLDTNPVSDIDGVFTRTIVFSSVKRNNSDDIATTGTIDTGSKKIDVQVSWLSPSGVNSKNITFYLTDIFN